jgi:hypothetical protein
MIAQRVKHSKLGGDDIIVRDVVDKLGKVR